MSMTEKVILRTKRIMDSYDSGTTDRAMTYLEPVNLNENVLLPPPTIDQNRIDEACP